MKVMEKYKLLPYGISNYAQIKREGKYMVDKTATDADAEKQWNEAEEQIRGYAKGEVVRQMTQGTELHLVIAQIKGYDLMHLDKVETERY